MYITMNGVAMSGASKLSNSFISFLISNFLTNTGALIGVTALGQFLDLYANIIPGKSWICGNLIFGIKAIVSLNVICEKSTEYC